MRVGTFPPYRWRKLHLANAWPPLDNHPSAHPLKVHRPWGRAASTVQAAQAPPLELRPPRGRQAPPGARTVRNLIACSCHRTGHDTGPTSSPASRRAPPMQTPCGSAALAPSTVEATACQLSATQIGSAQAARRTAPGRARSPPRRQRHPPSCKAGVAALEPACPAQQPASGPPGTPTPNPHPPALLMFFPCQPPCPADAAPCGSAVLAPSGGEAIVACQLPAPQTGSAQAARQTAPTRARSSPHRGRSLHPARPGWPPWSLRPNSRPPVLQGRPRPIPHPPSLLKLFPCQPPWPADAAPCASVLAPSSVKRSCLPASSPPPKAPTTRVHRTSVAAPVQLLHPPRSPRSTGGVSPSSPSEPPSCRGGASPQFPPAHLSFPRKPWPRSVRGITEASPARRPGSCPPLAPAGAASPTHRRAGIPVMRH